MRDQHGLSLRQQDRDAVAPSDAACPQRIGATSMIAVRSGACPAQRSQTSTAML
jgi:hypothetical protein